jgi:serine/threonine-protein kinase HipA
LSFKDQLGELITNIRPTQTRVPSFFSNLLPEGSMRDYLAERVGVNARREFSLLWVLGRDLPGGITIDPAEKETWPPGSREGGGHDNAHRGQQTALRFSLAGVQLKFSAVMEATGGLTIPAEGVGGAWIVKLPSMKFEGVPENEFAMMLLARMIGMDVPDVELTDLEAVSELPEGLGRLKGLALAVKRFDRTEEGGVIHSEDFAQVFGVYPERKYERASYRNIAEVIWAEIGEEGIAEFIRRLVFNALIGNADMHLKNWSLIYPDQRHPALSPGYDFVSTIAYIDDENMALSLLRSKSMYDLSIDTLVRFAAKARLPEKLVLRTGVEVVQKFMDAWAAERDNLPFASRMIETIERHSRNIELVREITRT